MSASLVSQDSLIQFNRFVRTHLGLYFSEDRLTDLERGVESAAREFGFQRAEPCLQWLMASPLTQSQIEILASHLTVGETYFFRDRPTMEALEKHILPELIRRGREHEKRLKIWSAGCCTGEEPYTLAILLSKLLPDIESWNMTILGTDINPNFIKKAAEGIYGEWSFRGVPAAIQETYFRKIDGRRFEILPDIKKRVSFSYLNLAEDAYPSHFNYTHAVDLIICQNVLMYLTRGTARKIVENFHHCLVDNGWLSVGPSDNAAVLSCPYAIRYFPDASFYTKTDGSNAESTIATELPRAWTFEQDATWVDPVPVIPNELPPAPPPLEKPVAPLAEPEPLAYSNALSKARDFANQGKLEDALRWSQKAVAEDKLNVAAYYLHATILHERGALPEAAAAFKRALYLDPNFVLAHFALGNLARQQRRLKEADRYWKNCSALLKGYREDDVLPESEGVTAGRLSAYLQVMEGSFK